VVRQLHSLWEQRGGEADFCTKHYLPMWEELTRGQLPETTEGESNE